MHLDLDHKPGYYNRHVKHWVVPVAEVASETEDQRTVRCPVCKAVIKWVKRHKHGCLREHLFALESVATQMKWGWWPLR